jgi:hypothetical protein
MSPLRHGEEGILTTGLGWKIGFLVSWIYFWLGLLDSFSFLRYLFFYDHWENGLVNG